MMLFFLYGYPSGLSLYIFTSSLIGIFEYRVIRKFWPPPTAATITLKPKTPKAASKAKLRR
jgi:membrane protein insertase Oxa1/YidC/SpoIIIJ